MRAHIAINVTDVKQSVAFYEKVFGQKPQKYTDGYAKFDLLSPALNFTMHASSEDKASRVNHLGIEVDSSEEVSNWEKVLTERGVLSAPEMNTDCCFARQDKVWFEDPDGNSWEIFHVLEQLQVTPKAQVCAPTSTGKKCC